MDAAVANRSEALDATELVTEISLEVTARCRENEDVPIVVTAAEEVKDFSVTENEAVLDVATGAVETIIGFGSSAEFE